MGVGDDTKKQAQHLFLKGQTCFVDALEPRRDLRVAAAVGFILVIVAVLVIVVLVVLVFARVRSVTVAASLIIGV